MDTTTALFYVFSAVLLLAALRVITARSTGARGAVPGAGLLQRRLRLDAAAAEFLAITLVLVYVGAVMVLFLFVVMMLDINSDAVPRGLLEALAAGRWSAR
jgi:NADH-quinone oxidoreductase subunit J